MTPLLGLDYGKRRIGIAASNDERTLAFAVGTHDAGRDGSVLVYLRQLIDERGVAGLVVGLPLRADGSEGELAAAVRAFAARLRAEFALPVHLHDERYTSQEADRYLRDASGADKGARDALAAEIILQNYLDRQRALARRRPDDRDQGAGDDDAT